MTHEDLAVSRLSRLDSCVVSDAMDSLGLSNGVLDGLRPLWEGATAAGRALTMELAEGETPAGAERVHLGARAIGRGGPGDVIVVANQGRAGMGSWGGLLTVAAQAQRIAGVVTDGDCRDVDEVRVAGFPVFGRGGAVRTARGRVHEVACGTPITIGAVRVVVGDLVLADGSGVVVVPAAQGEDVLARAESLAEKEATMAGWLRSGVTPAEVLGADYEDLLVRHPQAPRTARSISS